MEQHPLLRKTDLLWPLGRGGLVKIRGNNVVVPISRFWLECSTGENAPLPRTRRVDVRVRAVASDEQQQQQQQHPRPPPQSGPPPFVTASIQRLDEQRGTEVRDNLLVPASALARFAGTGSLLSVRCVRQARYALGAGGSGGGGGGGGEGAPPFSSPSMPPALELRVVSGQASIRALLAATESMGSPQQAAHAAALASAAQDVAAAVGREAKRAHLSADDAFDRAAAAAEDEDDQAHQERQRQEQRWRMAAAAAAAAAVEAGAAADEQQQADTPSPPAAARTVAPTPHSPVPGLPLLQPPRPPPRPPRATAPPPPRQCERPPSSSLLPPRHERAPVALAPPAPPGFRSSLFYLAPAVVLARKPTLDQVAAEIAADLIARGVPRQNVGGRSTLPGWRTDIVLSGSPAARRLIVVSVKGHVGHPALLPSGGGALACANPACRLPGSALSAPLSLTRFLNHANGVAVPGTVVAAAATGARRAGAQGDGGGGDDAAAPKMRNRGAIGQGAVVTSVQGSVRLSLLINEVNARGGPPTGEAAGERRHPAPGAAAGAAVAAVAAMEASDGGGDSGGDDSSGDESSGSGGRGGGGSGGSALSLLKLQTRVWPLEDEPVWWYDDDMDDDDVDMSGG